MSRRHGTSPGGVCTLTTASSCAFDVASFQIDTCSSWFVLVSVPCSKSLFENKICQIKSQKNTSGLTGQHPRTSVSTNRISLRSRYAHPSAFVPGPLLFAPGHLIGNAQPCAYEHEHAMPGSSVVRRRSPCEVVRQLFLPLCWVLTHCRCRGVQGQGRECSNICGGKVD